MAINQNFPPIRPAIGYNFVKSKSLDGKLAFSRAQSLATSGATSGLTKTTYIDKGTTLASVDADVPRFNYDLSGNCLGLLLEGQKTNFVRNNTMAGAVAGVPGTVPTNWSISTSNEGISREIVAIGVEDGISYIDIRWTGTVTPNSGNTGYWAFNPQNIITEMTATNLTRYAFSSYIKHIAGTIPASPSAFMKMMYPADSSTANLQEYQITNIPLSSTTNKKLIECRYTHVNTNDWINTNTAYIRPYYQWNFNTGQVIDVTLRIGMPQIEQSDFESSVIGTSASSVTRAKETLKLTGKNFTNRYNIYEGTAVVKYNVTADFNKIGRGGNTNTNVYSFNASSSSLGWNHYLGGNGGNVVLFRNTGGSNEAFLSSSAGSTAKTRVVSSGFALNDFYQYINRFSVGSALTDSDTLGQLRTDITELEFNRNGNGVEPLFGHIEWFKYYPDKFSNSIIDNLAK